MWKLQICILNFLIVFSLVKGQDDANDFGPSNLNKDIDSFIYEDREYLLISFDFRPSAALLYCEATFQAQLVEIKTEPLALFLADALSETDHALDNVWTAGEKKREKWVWPVSNEAVNAELLKKYYITRENETEYNVTRQCLGFRRNTHDLPRFLSLSCRLPRPPICERAKSPGGEWGSGSIHPGWIKIRDRYYKIYQDRVAYANASKNCIRHDRAARLAVIVSKKDAEQLARYMVIGRPKIENAWIGGRWSKEKEKYVFEDEDLELDNSTDIVTGYPPWRGGQVQKIGGCLLLDRHGAEGGGSEVHFIEARCARFRPYICYKKADTIGEPTFDNEGLRIFYHPRPWGEAKKYCESFSKPGALTEPRTKEAMNTLLYIMGENYTDVNQIWLGGLYEEDEWTWLSDDTKIPTNEKYPVWLTNDTHTEDVEDNNRCLNLDRENHKVGIFYGADCSFPQRFICYWENGIPPDAYGPEGQLTPGQITPSTATPNAEIQYPTHDYYEK